MNTKQNSMSKLTTDMDIDIREIEYSDKYEFPLVVEFVDVEHWKEDKDMVVWNLMIASLKKILFSKINNKPIPKVGDKLLVMEIKSEKEFSNWVTYESLDKMYTVIMEFLIANELYEECSNIKSLYNKVKTKQ